MFADPTVMIRDYTTITANAGYNLGFPASERAADHSTYRTVDADNNDHVLFVGHQYGRRNRFTVRYTISGVTPALLVPDQNQSFSQSCYAVFDCPTSGPIDGTGSVTLLTRKLMNGIGGYLTSITGADPLMVRVVKGET